MRPRLIASAPGLDDQSLTPFERFEKFARMIASVPKAEADAVAHELKEDARESRPTKRQERNDNASHYKT